MKDVTWADPPPQPEKPSGQSPEQSREGSSLLGKLADVIYSDGMKDFVAHGAHEMSSLLFTGNAYVQYGHGRHDDGGVHGPEAQKPEAPETPIQPPDTPEQERGGRGR